MCQAGASVVDQVDTGSTGEVRTDREFFSDVLFRNGHYFQAERSLVVVYCKGLGFISPHVTALDNICEYSLCYYKLTRCSIAHLILIS